MSSKSRRLVKPPVAQPMQQVVPQPLPEQWQIGPFSDGAGNQGVAVQIHTLNGTHVSFLTKEFALNLAEKLKQQAGSAPSIIVAPASAVAQLDAAVEAQAQQQ